MHRSAAIILAALLASCSSGTAPRKTDEPTLKKVEAAAEEAAPQPDAPIAPGALMYTLELEIDHEHGCSQSHQSTGVDIDLKLQVSETNEATLTLDLESTVVTGPSFGKFQQGEKDFHTTHSEEYAWWTGTAKRSGSRLSITFEWYETPGYEPQAPGSDYQHTRAPTDLTMVCAMSSKPVYPAVVDDESFWDVDGKTAEPAEILLCKPSQEILGWHHDMALVDGGIPLASPPGISMLSSYMFYNESQVIRHTR